MKVLKEFKDFINKGNVVDLAVAVVIGGAFGKIVSAVVADMVMPLVNAVMPQGDWRKWEVTPLHFRVGDFLGTRRRLRHRRVRHLHRHGQGRRHREPQGARRDQGLPRVPGDGARWRRSAAAPAPAC